MTNLRLRLIELGLLAALGLIHAPGNAAAEPPRPTRAADAHRDRDLDYVYFRGEEHTTMSGDTRDLERARRVRQGKESLLWFRDGGQEYVIRDPDTLSQADALWKPVGELGEAQGKLGSQLGNLGTQQGRLGSQQGLLGTRQGTLAVREATLEMRESNDTLSPADKAALAKQRRELRQQQRALENQMRALDKPMRELSEQMEPLGRQIEALGEKLSAASRKAEADMHALLRHAIAAGLAKPIK
jgi:hypothetical protein